MLIKERLLPSDFVFKLTEEVNRRREGRTIQVVSDFDETQCSSYVFSEKWGTHVPNVRPQLAVEAQEMINPMCIATGRGAKENVSWVAWRKLSRQPMPLVAENGSVLVWPSEKVGRLMKSQVLMSEDQFFLLQEMREKLFKGLVNQLHVPQGHELLLRDQRMASVELRAQDEKTKRGTPNDYAMVIEQLVEMFPRLLPFIDFVESGSSLGIQAKGVSKETGIAAALVCAGIEIDSVFLVGFGDNKNDESLFTFVQRNGGLAIGVRPSVNECCDFVFDGGDMISLEILRMINLLK